MFNQLENLPGVAGSLTILSIIDAEGLSLSSWGQSEPKMDFRGDDGM